VKLDITIAAEITAARARCRDVALLINNAGINLQAGLITAADLGAARAEIETNYLGPLAMCRAFAPVLKANGGGDEPGVKIDPGIVDEEGDVAAPGARRGNLRGAGDVELHRLDLAIEARGEIGKARGIARAGIDLGGAARGQRLDEGATDPAIGTGDQHDFPSDLHGSAPSSLGLPIGLQPVLPVEPSCIRLGQRNGGQKRPRIRVARNGEERFGGARLDRRTAPKHYNTIAQRAHDGKIVADEDEGEAEIAPQCAQQGQGLRLCRDVEAGDDLLADDTGGLDRDGAGNAGALALPAAQLMGKASAEARIEVG